MLDSMDSQNAGMRARTAGLKFCLFTLLLALFTLTLVPSARAASGYLLPEYTPVYACDGSGLGIATLYWGTQGTVSVEIRRNAPDGPLVTQSGPGDFGFKTAKDVSNGTVFYLQDVSGGKPLTAANTIATTMVNVTTDGCGTLTATPNPVRVCDGSGTGAVTLDWSSQDTVTVEVHTGAPDGPVFATTSAGSFSAATGKWVTEGMTFYLQDVTDGRPLTMEFNLAVVTVHLTTDGCGTITATPNPIQVCDGSGKGVTTLNWTTAGTKTVEVHRSSPTGSLVSRSGPGTRSATTGKWVKNGDVFYLQDVSDGKPLTPENTLGVVQVALTTTGCPAQPQGTLTATPNPVRVCDGSGTGAVTLDWTSQDTSTVEVHIGAPDGPVFATTSAGSFSAATGKWVTEGMTFYLQDVTNGAPLDASHTLASATVHLTTTGCGTITATPNPIQVCDGSGKGVTTLNWTTSGTKNVEVRFGAPNGSLISRSGPGARSVTTGKWVKNGNVFYLQDVSDGKPLTSDNTLGIVQVALTTDGCPPPPGGTLTAMPNPIRVCDGSGFGTTTLNWSSQGVDAVEIHIGAPNGPVFTSTSAGSFSAATGKWVTEGMTFYLQDVTNGAPLDASHTLASATVHLTTDGCGTITATPNPVVLCDGTGLAVTTLNWNTVGTKTVEVHRNAPNGSLVSRSGSGARSVTTGKWVKNGDVFYLQDVSDGKPLTSDNTLGVVQVTLTTDGCPAPSIVANPNPIQVCDGSGQGVTTLNWAAYNTSQVDVRIGSPSGSLFTRTGSGPRSATTGKWVKNGTVFYLQDTANGKPLTPENTLATTTVNVTTDGCTAPPQ